MPDLNAMDLFRLDDRVAIVTGGSKGLGFNIALGLAQAGAITVVCSRHADESEVASSRIATDTGRDSLGLDTDVSVEVEVDGLVDRVMEEFGRIDVLVNNAGINSRHPIESFPIDEYRQMIDVNLTGTWLCCRAVAPIMKQQGRGTVINVASTLSAVGIAEMSAYAASKAGVVGLTRSLALEWAPSGVRCNALCPGPFATEMTEQSRQDRERSAWVAQMTALGRWGEAHEIRGAALFLAGDASTFVTGSTLFVDGGWTAA